MRSKVDDARIASRRAKVAEMLLRGVTNQVEICQRLGMEPEQRTTISRDITFLNSEWRDLARIDLDEAKGRELAKLTLIETAAWESWEKSKQPAETLEATKHRTARGGEEEGEQAGDKETLKKTSKGQVGDKGWLHLILDCLAHKRAILGLDAPEKRELGGKLTVSVSTDDVKAAIAKAEEFRRATFGTG